MIRVDGPSSLQFETVIEYNMLDCFELGIHFELGLNYVKKKLNKINKQGKET